MKTKVSKVWQFYLTDFLYYFFFLMKDIKYLNLDTDMSPIIEIYSIPTKAILLSIFLIGHIHLSNSNSHSSSSNEWILIVSLLEHSVNPALFF
jgi:hypothetical protein